MAQVRGRGGRRGSPPAPTLAPVVLIEDSEPLLAERAVDALRRQAAQADPQVERTSIDAGDYRRGELAQATSPSLFGEARLVEVDHLEHAEGALRADLAAYLGAPAPGAWVVVRERVGKKARTPGDGRKATHSRGLVEAVRAARFPVLEYAEVRRVAEKVALVSDVVREAGRRIERDAAQALVDAVGSDLRELAAAADQLASDTAESQGPIGAADVRRYYAGRVEANGFEVADAALAGNAGRALTLLRHALATGAAPVLLVATVAMRLRDVAIVSGGSRPPGRAPWQVDQVRRLVHGWDERGLARAIEAVARADEEVKGASRDPDYAVERCVLALCTLRGASRGAARGDPA